MAASARRALTLNFSVTRPWRGDSRRIIPSSPFVTQAVLSPAVQYGE